MKKSTTSRTADQIVWRVPLWAWAPIALAVVAEAAVNALRAYGLGMELEHFTVNLAGFTVSISGVMLVLAAIALSLSQARAAWVAFKPGALARQRTIAAPIALLLLTVSVSALALTLLEAQRGKSGDEGSQRTAYDIAKGDHDKAEAEWKRLAGARTPAEVQAAMQAAPVDRTVFRRTKECNEVTRQDSFDACKPILDLRQEMAGAIRKIELEQALPGLKAALDALPRPAEPTWVEEIASSGWSWAFGLAAVLVATFGAPLFAEPVKSPAPAAPNAPVRTVIVRKDRPEGGVSVRPNRPAPKGPDRPADNSPDGRTDDQKGRVLAFVQTEQALGRIIPSQNSILNHFPGLKRSTLSDWMGDWERSKLIPKRLKLGRCKVIAATEKRKATA